MLYDVFICHASEDKDSFVRPLANALQREHVEVWYDEFSLKLGDSIRQTIDKGLRQSRFGVVVLSEAFFQKQWTQYELDGLVELEHQGSDRVLLPVWHNVTRRDVLSYSASLAGRKAAISSNGLSKVVTEILNTIRPQGSPFIHARDKLLTWGISPPVITDEYWLDVVEASNRIPAYGAYMPEESAWDRWSFPLPERAADPMARGERLAWTAMQLRWTAAAEQEAITILTQPDKVLQFIDAHPGLFETCLINPGLVAEYAPQLTIPGFGGDLEPYLEDAYQKSCIGNSGSGLTVDGKPPRCDVEWALRHPDFGGYKPDSIVSAYFAGGIFGPNVSPYDHSQHFVWLLSSASKWLPMPIHHLLLEGMISWPLWVSDSKAPSFNDALVEAVWDATTRRKSFKWNDAIRNDVMNRIHHAISTLGLPDDPDSIMREIVERDFPSKLISAQRERDRLRRQQ